MAGGAPAYLLDMSEITDIADIALSPAAAARVARIAEKQGKPAILRLSVEGGGCAGFLYKFGLAAIEDGDRVVETDGVSLVVDDVSLDLVRGSIVDFVESLGGAAVQVRNTPAASGGGCGPRGRVAGNPPAKPPCGERSLVSTNESAASISERTCASQSSE